MIDLWPEKIPQLEVKPPAGILREQAALLGPKTQHVVEARVHQLATGDPTYFSYRFEIVAPGLGDYTYGLFQISHDIQLYPVIFQVDQDIGKAIAAEFTDRVGSSYQVDTEDEFIAVLGCILGAPKTIRIIASLLAQVEVAAPEEEILF